MTEINSDNSVSGAGDSQAAALSLTAVEARVLGVLVEKERTTPDLYPLTINALVNGANQKNNRNPVTDYDQDEIRQGVNSLRHKGLVLQSDTTGSRASKYRHTAAEKLGVNMRELVILAELLLRGPQTLGELRGRASRMHPLESLEVVRSTLEQLQNRQPSLVRQVRSALGSRAERYAQLLCAEEFEEADEAGPAEPADTAAAPSQNDSAGKPAWVDRVSQLEAEVASIRDVIRRLAASLGSEDPFAEGK